MKRMLLSIFLLLFVSAGCSSEKSLDGETKIEDLDGLTEIEALYGVDDFEKYSKEISYEDLAREPEKNQGKLFWGSGTIGQVMEVEEETQYLIVMDGDPSHILYAHFLDDNPNSDGKRILENDIIEFRAASIGMIDYETANNTTKTVPNAILHSYEAVDDYAEENEVTTIDFSGYKEFEIGQTVIFETGHEVTVNDIFETFEESNNFINGRYIRVDFSFKNGESETVTLGGPSVKLYNYDGTEATMDSKNFLYDEIIPGETLEKSIYFDAGNGPYRVIFGDSLWVSEQ